MTVAEPAPMTLAQFLEWERRQDLRYEFDGFQPIAMTGGSRAHAAIQRNLAISLGTRLRGRPCQFYGSDLKIEVAGKIRYPDGFVVCGQGPLGSTVVRDPVVIFEVLSPSTSRTDRIVKTREYQATPSVQRYVILEQDSIAATVFTRLDGQWTALVLLENATLSLPEIDVELPLAELYDGLVFQPEDSEPSQPRSD